MASIDALANCSAQSVAARAPPRGLDPYPPSQGPRASDRTHPLFSLSGRSDPVPDVLGYRTPGAESVGGMVFTSHPLGRRATHMQPCIWARRAMGMGRGGLVDASPPLVRARVTDVNMWKHSHRLRRGFRGGEGEHPKPPQLYYLFWSTRKK